MFSLRASPPEGAVDEAISEFDLYQQENISGAPLTRFESAAIKTFCAYYLGLGPNNPHSEKATSGDHG